MAADLFLFGCALVFGLGFRFLFRHLPEERWQFVASLPLKKKGIRNQVWKPCFSPHRLTLGFC
jgi:hypothetical protein